MAVVSVTETDNWFVARSAFRQLLTRTQEISSRSDDIATLERAMALDGLFLHLLEPDQAHRLGTTLAQAAAELGAELRDESDDRRKRWLSGALSELETQLQRAQR